MPCSLTLTALRAEKPIASAELGGGSSKFHVLTVPFVTCRKGRAGSACEPRPGLHENFLKHVARFPERFLTTASAGNAPRHGRNRDDVALTPSFNLHGETVHERLLSLESRQGSSERKDALSKPPTQPLRMGFPHSGRARGTGRAWAAGLVAQSARGVRDRVVC